MDGNVAPVVEEVEDFYDPIDEESPRGEAIPAGISPTPRPTLVNDENHEDTVYDEVENEWEPDIDIETRGPQTKSSPTSIELSTAEAPEGEVPEEIAEFPTAKAQSVPDALDESIVEELPLPDISVNHRSDSIEVEDTVEIVEEVEIVDHMGTTQGDSLGSDAELDENIPSIKDSKVSGNPDSGDSGRAEQYQKVQVETRSSAVVERDPALTSQNNASEPADAKKKSRSMALAEHKRKALAAEQQMQLQAEQEQEAKANALKARAAKRIEEQEKREQRELAKQRRKAAADQRAAAQGDGIAAGELQSDEAAEHAGRLRAGQGAIADEPGDCAQDKAPHIRGTGSHANKMRSMVKNSKVSEGGADGGGDWNDSIAAPVSASRKERHEAVERRRQERLEARARKLAGAADTSIAEGNAAEEGSEVLRPYPVKPDQQQGRSHNTKRRLRPQPTLGSADGDADRLVLPPLVGAKQPRSSPNPARAALSSLLRDSEFPEPGESAYAASPSGKPRRSRKPLYLRMIEKAQAQYVEDERRKHESYVEQKKLKQKNNPTQEELRMHRRKHDELVQAKLEEGRRNLAEAAAANARALKRQQAVASAVQTALDEKGEGELVVDGTSPLRKRQTKKKKALGVVVGDGGGALEDMMPLPPLNSAKQKDGAGVAVDYGFSPSKSALGDADAFSDSRHGSAEDRRNAGASPAALVSVTAGVHSLALGAPSGSDRADGGGPGEGPAGLDGSPAIRHVPLEFDAGAAAAAVQKIPALAPHSIPTYCASDWLDKLTTADADLPTTAGMSTGSSAQVLLKPVPPHSDAQRLMNFAVP